MPLFVQLFSSSRYFQRWSRLKATASNWLTLYELMKKKKREIFENFFFVFLLSLETEQKSMALHAFSFIICIFIFTYYLLYCIDHIVHFIFAVFSHFLPHFHSFVFCKAIKFSILNCVYLLTNWALLLFLCIYLIFIHSLFSICRSSKMYLATKICILVWPTNMSVALHFVFFCCFTKLIR